MTAGFKVAMFMNIKAIKAMIKLDNIAGKATSSESISKLVFDATGDQDLADETYTQLEINKSSNHKNVDFDPMKLMGLLG